VETIVSEEFGLYRIEVEEDENTGSFFYDIQSIDEDGAAHGEHFSTAKGYPQGYDAFRAGMIRLAALFWQDIEEIKSPSDEGDEAGNGTRTHDILLGKQTLYQLSYTRS
jgi:hypothetical protein